jgi:hypothetical protein
VLYHKIPSERESETSWNSAQVKCTVWGRDPVTCKSLWRAVKKSQTYCMFTFNQQLTEGVIHVDFLPHGVTVNAQYYRNLLQNNVHQTILKKIHGQLLKKIILLHDNACPHMANLTKVTLTTMGWKIMNYPPCSHDLVPSDQHLFGPIKLHLGGQISNWWRT